MLKQDSRQNPVFIECTVYIIYQHNKNYIQKNNFFPLARQTSTFYTYSVNASEKKITTRNIISTREIVGKIKTEGERKREREKETSASELCSCVFLFLFFCNGF